MRDLYLRLSSDELKQKLQTYNGALTLGTLRPETYDQMHEYVNVILDILKERDEL